MYVMELYVCSYTKMCWSLADSVNNIMIMSYSKVCINQWSGGVAKVVVGYTSYWNHVV